MKSFGQTFLDTLANLPPDTFESRFSRTSTRLGLGAALNRNELTLLYEAAFRAELCNVALNGLGEPDGRIKPEDEANRIKLETEFLTARDIFFASPGWQTLTASEQGPIQSIFLSVVVAEGRLAR